MVSVPRRRHITRRSALLAFVLGLILVMPALAATIPRLEGAVTDLAGALGATDEIEQALDTLLEDHGVQLFVLFVDTTEDLTVTEYADETARVNSLGAGDALLLVAVEDRTDAIWVSDFLPITDQELDAIIVDTLEPGLRDGDFAAATIATAEALGLAAEPAPVQTAPPGRTLPPDQTSPPTTPGGNDDGDGLGLGTLVGIVLLGTGIVVLGLWLVGRLAAWRETGERSRRAATLARDANARLIAADDRIRAAEQETGFVEAEFGEGEAAPFRESIAEARRELRAAFALRQRLDDADPEDPPTRETMLTQIIECSDRANAALDAQADRIEELRSLERDAPTILAGLPMQLETVERRLPGAERTLADMATFAEAAWAPVKGNLAEARKGLAGARAAIDRGSAAVPTNRPAAVREIVVAQRGIAGAASLLDAIDKLAETLRAATTGVSGDLDAADRDLADAASAAHELTDGDPTAYAERLAKARRDLDVARGAAGETPLDPISTARESAAARAAAADLLASVRRDAEQAARLAAAVDSWISAAKAEIDRAADFVAGRHGGVRRRARTRLVEAERQLDLAVELRATDARGAMEAAQRADKLAGEAYTLASDDFARWDAGRGGASSQGADIAGAILGGIIGGILGGGGRHAGWGGSTWGSPGPPGGGSSGGPFGGGGGWGGGGRSSGGGFGGFGGGGGGGGHARGGRW